MKIRLKFTKEGPVRYVGHLDFMRCFQKGLQKSGLPAVYSAGFNPHMLMSFAEPLAIGEETLGDYVDVDFAFRDRADMDGQEAYRLQDLGLDNDALPDPPSPEELCRILTESMPEGVRVTDAVRVGLTKGSKAMALVRYAAWKLVPVVEETSAADVSPQLHSADSADDSVPADELTSAKVLTSSDASIGGGGLMPEAALSSVNDSASSDALNTGDVLTPETVQAYMAQPAIPYLKKTKSGMREIDIRPMIESFSMDEDGTFSLTCASGSSVNLKWTAVMETFFTFAGKTYEPFSYRGIRLELCDADMTPLSELGSAF